ncbi:MAG: hypothetical protein IT258_24280, partial [Saprospiraceae bacterium]|nr:hypothetical protein [Saprospiraceae bacterium]
LYRLDKDLYISWEDYDWDNKILKEKVRFGDDIIEECNRSVQQIYQKYWWRYKVTPDQTGFISKMKSLIDQKEYAWKDEYRLLFYEFILRDLMPLGVYPRLPYKLRLFYDNILVMPAGEARQIELDKAMSVQDAFLLRDDWALNALLMAAKHDDYQTRISAFKTLQAAYIAFQKSYPEREKYLKDALTNEGHEWEQAVEKSKRWLDELKANKAEIMALENDATNGVRYVAVISQSDSRCLFYYSKNSKEELRQRAFERFIAKNPSADSSDFHFEIDRFFGMTDNKIIQEDIVANLEKHVLDYILWAKQQRGY